MFYFIGKFYKTGNLKYYLLEPRLYKSYSTPTGVKTKNPPTTINGPSDPT